MLLEPKSVEQGLDTIKPVPTGGREVPSSREWAELNIPGTETLISEGKKAHKMGKVLQWKDVDQDSSFLQGPP